MDMVEDLPPAKGARCFRQGSLLVRRPDRARAFQGSRSTTGCVAMTPAGYWFIACGEGCLSLRTSPRGRRRRNGPRELGGAARGWRLDHDRPPPRDHPHDRAAAGRTGNAPGRAITAGSLGSFRALGKIAKLEMFETQTFPRRGCQAVRRHAGCSVLQLMECVPGSARSSSKASQVSYHAGGGAGGRQATPHSYSRGQRRTTELSRRSRTRS
jgi:hypothetical protein